MNKLDLKKAISSIKDVFRKDIVTKINELIDRENGTGIGAYKKYVAIVSQSGTDAPTSVVLENTFGVTPTWSYGTDGSYNLTVNGGFPDPTKLFILISDGRVLDIDASYKAVCIVGIWSTNSIINFQTNISGANGPANNLFSNTCIELRVYN
jgi:hypothetical protein